MQQRKLFESDGGHAEAGQATPFAIQSDRVGVVSFGATEASFALTREALADLAALPGDALEPPL